MTYRQKCKVKGKWVFIKFYGDAALYAMCHNCGFVQHGVYDMDGLRITLNPSKVYKYCPHCGLKMKLFNGEHIYKQNEPCGDFELWK